MKNWTMNEEISSKWLQRDFWALYSIPGVGHKIKFCNLHSRSVPMFFVQEYRR
jgi:hypothetical protein